MPRIIPPKINGYKYKSIFIGETGKISEKEFDKLFKRSIVRIGKSVKKLKMIGHK